MNLITPFQNRTRIAYFSMEIAIHPEIPTCAGGLGVLAGDTARSCADLELPVVFVSLVSRAGYFRQRFDPEGRQVEEPDTWDPASWCTPMDAMIAVRIEQRLVWIRPWLYVHSSDHGHMIPVLLLDTDLPQNAPEDRTITHFLYGGDETYRLKQEIVLGIGGLRLLRALGLTVETHHLNEGHAALLLLELLDRSATRGDGKPQYDTAYVRSCCVFTTHTPVESGHDRFSYELVQRLLTDFIPLDIIKQFGGNDQLNMTRLALNLAGFVNGVARRHAETTAHLFPGYPIHAITNGVHPQTWTHPAFAELYSRRFPHWRHEPEQLVRVLQFSEDDLWRCHEAAKQNLIEEIERRVGKTLSSSVPIIGFARRMTGYKRPTLLFQDLARLATIAERCSFQVVVAGKAHPRDAEGKAAIEAIHAIARQLEGKVSCVFLPNYDMRIAKALVSGCDIWLNTPLPPLEASGTSGMKAALNGVLNLSILDGWWIEACIEGVTGWGIDRPGDDEHEHAQALYRKLSDVVLPLYYDEPGQWRRMMKQSIAHIASYFNSQRMMRRYASEAYLR
ncbi:alpha-glucan family phosphorylase [Caballeronia sp. AZ1_KS37]|uniref:alpha-glucan family phosphorylase n=1 Tax=Caballeronia sp. AZ1_KS37 TaxID=2921756 RepID=UPI0020278791|nr:alpha-glucan family phosphorylase [Caballeronia sp. AZ1_KS37]